VIAPVVALAVEPPANVEVAEAVVPDIAVLAAAILVSAAIVVDQAGNLTFVGEIMRQEGVQFYMSYLKDLVRIVSAHSDQPAQTSDLVEFGN
jgi:hypothetical protein